MIATTSPAELARGYLKRGWRVTPVRDRQKVALLKDWPNVEIDTKDVDQLFPAGRNIGLRTGGGLVDVDLDDPLVLRLASAFLPETGCIWGRHSNPASHRLYLCGKVRSVRFRAPSGKTYVEIRADGHQTLLPGSVHPSGESYAFVQDGEPARIEAAQLRQAVGQLAAAALLIENYPARGSRHDFALALAGVLLRSGFDQGQAEAFIAVIAEEAGDDEIQDRLACIASTAARLTAGEAATGAPMLASLLMPGVGQKALNWLRTAILTECAPLTLIEESKIRVNGAHSVDSVQEITESTALTQSDPLSQRRTLSGPGAADLPPAPLIGPFDPIWKKQKPYLYLVYARLSVLARAALAKRTPTYRGKSAFYAHGETLAGDEMSRYTAVKALKILKHKGLIERVPFSWCKEHKDFLASNGHWGQQKHIPAYWILRVPQGAEKNSTLSDSHT